MILPIVAAIIQPAMPQEEVLSGAFYLPCDLLFPAQIRISYDNVEDKIEKAKARGNAVWENDSWIFKHNQGTSLFSLQNPIPVVKAPFGYIPADGHHDIRATLALGASTIPVKVIADYSHLPTDLFWQKAEEEGWAYLIDLDGKKSKPLQRFEDLIDDPNRRFAALTARKYDPDGSSRGAEYPLWIKQGRDIPFIEFKIADALRCQGLHYSPGDENSPEFIEKARSILLNAKIEGLKVVPDKVHYSKLYK